VPVGAALISASSAAAGEVPLFQFAPLDQVPLAALIHCTVAIVVVPV
jgi:hypothetical protein